MQIVRRTPLKHQKPEALKSVAVIIESLKQMDHDSGIQGFRGSKVQCCKGFTQFVGSDAGIIAAGLLGEHENRAVAP
jgi:hypothetical protein